jgi:hypothetical protein
MKTSSLFPNILFLASLSSSTYVSSASPGSAFGTQQYILISGTNVGYFLSFVRFDVSNLPHSAGAPDIALLKLRATCNVNGSILVKVDVCGNNWNTGITFNSFVDDASPFNIVGVDLNQVYSCSTAPTIINVELNVTALWNVLAVTTQLVCLLCSSECIFSSLTVVLSFSHVTSH